MQPTYRQTKTCSNACIGGGLLLRAYVLLASVYATGCSNPMFDRTCSPRPDIACTDLETLNCASDWATGSTSDSFLPETCFAGTDPQNGHLVHAAVLPNIGSRFKNWGAQAGSHLHNNFVTRSMDAHKARRLAKIEAKNAPPWPTFHPIPTRPVFFPDDSQVMDNESEMPNSTSPTANYGQFVPAK